MTVKTNIKAGGRNLNHNDTLVRAAAPRGVQTRTNVKAGRLIPPNHNESLVRAAQPSLRVRTHVKVGGKNLNHNETLVRA